MINRLKQHLALLPRKVTRLPFGMFWLAVYVTGALVPWLTRDNPDKKQRGEWYPFSNFPMYSSFEKQAYYVYVTDLEDNPLPLVPVFGNMASGVKKIYDKLLKEEARALKKPSKIMTAEESKPAGDRTLQQIRESSHDQERVRQYPGFRLYQVDIFLKDNEIVKETKLVGEIR